jgi:hypothetical protein
MKNTLRRWKSGAAVTRAIGHQTYKFGWCYAVGNLSSVNLGLVHRLITDWSNNESIRVFLEVMAAIIGLTVGLAATLVRPWSWYVLTTWSLFAPIWACLYLVFVVADWRLTTALIVLSFTIAPPVFVYFYKRRAMFGVVRRSQRLERWYPMIIGPAAHDAGRVPGFAGLSLGRRWLYVFIVLVMSFIL